ncbi:MAG: M48 family metallopeptidase [Thermoplasmata archaeon]
METPSIGYLLAPVLLWIAAGAALGVSLRRPAATRLTHRLGAVFVGLWALLATTALAWVLLNGGWSAIAGLWAAPPEVFTPDALGVWAIGALGALTILAVAFALNQSVERSFLRIFRSEPIDWPESLRGVAGSTRLYEVDLARADAFAFTLVTRTGGRLHREEVVVISRRLRGALLPAEEVAVLAHELGHVRELDGRYLTYLRTFSRLMRWDPVLGYLASSLSRREELRADSDAIELTRRPLALARAIYKSMEIAPVPDARGAVGFLGGGGRRGRSLALERIRRLLSLSESGEYPEERSG